MALDKTELKQLFDRLIFEQTAPEDWVQDVWGLSPLMGESAAKLFEIYGILIDCCPPEKLEALWQSLYAQSQAGNYDQN